jgi:hypothetical protein
LSASESPSSSFSEYSSSSPAGAPKGFSGALLPLNVPPEPTRAAKLESPPSGRGAPNAPALNPVDPSPPKPDAGMAPVANGDGPPTPPAELKPPLDAAPRDPNPDVDPDEAPKVPNGDLSPLAKADKPDEAKAELEVIGLSFSFADGVVPAAEANRDGDFADTRAPKGEMVDVFTNPDVGRICACGQRQRRSVGTPENNFQLTACGFLLPADARTCSSSRCRFFSGSPVAVRDAICPDCSSSAGSLSNRRLLSPDASEPASFGM